jgi:hypothetical protein
VLEATLTTEERDRWLDRMAREITRRRMETPAAFALEMHRPLAFLGSQALLVAMPFFAGLVGPENVLKFSRLMEDRQNIDRLLDRIEELVAERSAPSSPHTEAPYAP